MKRRDRRVNVSSLAVAENDQPPHFEFRPQHVRLHPGGDLLPAAEAQPAGRHLQQTAEAAARPALPASAGILSARRSRRDVVTES